MNRLRNIIFSIQRRPNYKTHTVLDGGKCHLLILTKDNRWFEFYQGNWSKALASSIAEELCHTNYLGYRYRDMMKGE